MSALKNYAFSSIFGLDSGKIHVEKYRYNLLTFQRNNLPVYAVSTEVYVLIKSFQLTKVSSSKYVVRCLITP